MHVADQREQRAAADARGADEQQVAARRREHALHAHGVGEGLGEEDEVELLDLALEGLEAAAHLGEHVRLLAPLEHERAVGRRADALGRTDEQRRVGDLFVLERVVEVRAQRTRDDAVEARAVLPAHQPVAQHAVRLEGPGLVHGLVLVDQLVPAQGEVRLRVRVRVRVRDRVRVRVNELVPQQAAEPGGEVARREEVVALLVHRELLARGLPHVHHAGGELPG